MLASAARECNTRWRWLRVGGIASAAAIVAAAVFWTAGFPPDSWIVTLDARDNDKTPSTPTRAPTPQPSRPENPATDIRDRFPGISSSTSEEPRALILTGTVLGQNAFEGQAFIGVDERNPQTFVAGAILANGARLVEIAKDHVVLERDGERVRLYAQNVKSKAPVQSDVLLVGAPQSFQPATSTNTESYTEFLRPNPVYENDRLVGYEVYPGRASGTFSRLGLRAGDIIVELDGRPISDPQNTLETLSTLSQGAALTAVVRRKGERLPIALNGTVVVSEAERNNRVVVDASAGAGPPG